MYFVATLHPPIDPNSQDAKDGFLSIPEKIQVIESFYDNSNGEKETPLCVDHGKGDSIGAGYKVGTEERVGKVLDLFNNKEGDLVVKGVISSDSKHYGSVNNAIFTDKEKWGVSVWIDIAEYRDDNGVITSSQKFLTHVALTNQPYFGKYNTFIHHWSLSEHAIDRVIAEEYVKEGDGGHSYTTQQFRDKLDKALKIPRLIPSLDDDEKEDQQQKKKDDDGQDKSEAMEIEKEKKEDDNPSFKEPDMVIETTTTTTPSSITNVHIEDKKDVIILPEEKEEDNTSSFKEKNITMEMETMTMTTVNNPIIKEDIILNQERSETDEETSSSSSSSFKPSEETMNIPIVKEDNIISTEIKETTSQAVEKDMPSIREEVERDNTPFKVSKSMEVGENKAKSSPLSFFSYVKGRTLVFLFWGHRSSY